MTPKLKVRNGFISIPTLQSLPGDCRSLQCMFGWGNHLQIAWNSQGFFRNTKLGRVCSAACPHGVVPALVLPFLKVF